ncbi:MAG: hypothetical protein ACI4Q7_01065 [Candidatus Avelusimicrobium sp.]
MSEELIIAILGGSASAAIVSGVTQIILWILNNRKKKDESGEKCVSGLQVLLYDRVKYLGLRHIEHGYISAEDLEDLQRMHKIYHNDLNGNGYLDNIMKRVNELPLKQ